MRNDIGSEGGECDMVSRVRNDMGSEGVECEMILGVREMRSANLKLEGTMPDSIKS